jgi:hypothetical protein
VSFKKATKYQSKLRLALCGLAGSGKTFSALSIATALAKLMRQHGHGDGRIAVIDSERGSASLYADKFDFDVCELDSFSPLAYVEKIREAEAAGYDIIIPDSLSHAWAGKGGALDQKDRAADRGGNSWTAWRDVTPKHNALVDAVVGSKAHVIATMRQKMEHVQEVVDGKTQIKKVGLASIQREGMEYEFTLVGDIDLTHALKISKTRVDGIDIGDVFERPGEAFARRVYTWLMAGASRPEPVAVPTPAPSAATTEVGQAVDDVFAAYLEAVASAPTLSELDARATGPGKPAKGTPDHKRATEAYLARKTELSKERAA